MQEGTTVPAFVNYDASVEYDKIELAKDQELYLELTKDTMGTVISNDLTYPVYTNHNGSNVIVIGNTQFYLNKEDQQYPQNILRISSDRKSSK